MAHVLKYNNRLFFFCIFCISMRLWLCSEPVAHVNDAFAEDMRSKRGVNLTNAFVQLRYTAAQQRNKIQIAWLTHIQISRYGCKLHFVLLPLKLRNLLDVDLFIY